MMAKGEAIKPAFARFDPVRIVAHTYENIDRLTTAPDFCKNLFVHA